MLPWQLYSNGNYRTKLRMLKPMTTFTFTFDFNPLIIKIIYNILLYLFDSGEPRHHGKATARTLVARGAANYEHGNSMSIYMPDKAARRIAVFAEEGSPIKGLLQKYSIFRIKTYVLPS